MWFQDFVQPMIDARTGRIVKHRPNWKRVIQLVFASVVVGIFVLSAILSSLSLRAMMNRFNTYSSHLHENTMLSGNYDLDIHSDTNLKDLPNARKLSLTIRGSTNETGSITHITESSQGHREVCERRLPKALVVGFAKCGTGSFMKFIDVHPDIKSSSPWEVRFFDKEYSLGIEWYKRQMPCIFSNQIAIEKTPHYSWEPKVPKRVFMLDKEMKIIFVVRDPVKRLISQYVPMMDLLPQHILLEDGSLKVTQDEVVISRYHLHYERWLTYFNKDQLHVVDGDSFAKNPVDELQKAEKFLGLRHYIEPEHFQYNETKGFFCRTIGSEGHKCPKEWKGRTHPTVEEVLLRKLYTFFKEENEKFFTLLGRRFNWTSPFD